MTKNRKSIFDTVTSDKDIQSAARGVQKKSMDSIPPKPAPEAAPEETDKPMHLYVDKAHHRQSKLNATLRNMKLGAYIEWLIEQDQERLK